MPVQRGLALVATMLSTNNPLILSHRQSLLSQLFRLPAENHPLGEYMPNAAEQEYQAPAVLVVRQKATTPHHRTDLPNPAR